MDRTYYFRDTRGLARIGAGFLIVQAALAGFAALSDFWTYSLADAALLDSVRTEGPFTTQDLRVLLIALVQTLLFVFGGIVILTWVSRANGNAHAIGNLEMETGSGWAVGWFFVPFANLFMPFRVVREIWQASLTALPSASPPPSALLVCWWLTWLASNITGVVAARIGWESQSAEALRASAGFDLASNLLLIPACLLLVTVITRIQTVQNRAAPTDSTGRMA